jgi:gliding motility-associated-like protein
MSYRTSIQTMKKIYKKLIIYCFLLFLSLSTKAQVTAGFTIQLPSPACNPAVVGFTNTSSGIAPLSYDWNFGVYPGTNSVFQNPFTTYIPCGTYNVQLIVTNGLGEKDTVTQSLTIYCKPVANFVVSGNGGCAPYTATYTDLSIANSGSIVDELWDFGDGYLGSGTNPSHTYTAIGCATMTLIVENTFGCTADTTVSSLICVNEPPAAAFTSTTPSGCAAPLNVNFTNGTTLGVAPLTYEWIFENASPPTSTATNPSATFNNVGSSGVTLIATDVNGCADTISYPSFVNIANNTVDFTVNSLEGCAPFTLNANGVSATAQTWSWAVSPTGQTSTSQNPNFNLNTPGTYTVCLTATYSGGCSSQKCSTIVVHPRPTADFSITGNAPTCIRPSLLTFTDNSVGDTLSYNWFFPGGSPASSNDSVPSSISYSSCGTYSAYLTVTDVNGCTASDPSINMFTITCPNAAFTAFPNSGCIPLTSTFNSSASSGGPFTYEWNFGDPSSGAANTSTGANPAHTYNNAGCYTITLIVTTVEGCKDTMVFPNGVCAGSLPIVNFTSNPAVACADDPVSFQNLTTGIFPYTTYQWDFVGVPPYDNMSSAFNPTYTYNDTGWFDVTLIASNYGCNDTLTIIDMEHILPPVARPTLTRDCATPYVVTLSGLSSLGADTYTWIIPGGNPSSAGTPTVSVTYTASGNYTASLYVTNATTGCDDITNISITIKDVEANFTGSPLSGCATLNACMTNTSTDANAYQWNVYNNATGAQVTSSTQTNPCFSLSTPGVYDVRLIATDQFGCTDTLYRTAYITVWGIRGGFYGTPLQGCTPLFVQFTDTTYSPTSIITSWAWNFGDPGSGSLNTSTLQNPSHTYNEPGTYTVKLVVTDNHGCTRTITKNNYVQAIKPSADFVLIDTTLCYGENACFINGSSGTSLTYEWDFGNGSTSTLSNPCKTYYVAGSYDITLITTDSYGCKDTIVKPNYVIVTKPTADFTADTLTSTCPPLAVSFTNLSSNIDPGTTYFWDFGDNSVSNAPNPVHTYNIAGYFDVTLIVTNANGCKDTLYYNDYIFIGGPQGYVTTPVTSGCAPLDVCFTANAPSAVYFTWNFGDGSVIPDDDSICYTYTEPGTYYTEVILDDGLGCVYALPIGDIHVGGAFANFNTDADTLCGPGTIQFTDSTWSYVGISTRLWNFGDPASGVNNTSTLQSPSHYFGAPGTYIVTLNVSSSDGCTNTSIDTIVVAPLPIAAFSMNDSTVCPPATIQFTDLSTSVQPITTYLWNFGDPSSGVLNTSLLQNPSHFYDSAGVYTITLTIINSLGCSDVTSVNLTVNPPVVADAGPDQSVCAGGPSAVINATGGATYSWSPSTGLSDPFSSSPLVLPLANTTYTVIVTSIFGCTGSDIVVITVNPIPTIDSIPFVADTCSVNSGAAQVNVSNGTSPYTYSWSNSATTSLIQNLSGGNSYDIAVTDANGCIATSTIAIPDLPAAVLNTAGTNSTCSDNNGSVDLNVTGGNAPFIFVWNNGATTEDLLNILAGNYDVTVTDNFGCTVSINAIVNDIVGPDVNVYPQNTTCSNPNGTADLVVMGGSPPLSYIWDHGQTTEDLVNVDNGLYIVTVTDVNGCTGIDSVFIGDAPGPVLNASAINATCNLSNGAANISITGGTNPLMIIWNAGFSYDTNLVNIPAGNYEVLVIDSNNCQDSVTVTVGDTPSPQLTWTLNNATCGNANGSINVTITAGVPPYSYIWNTGATTQDLVNVTAGNYFLTITGANGCSLDTVISLSNINGSTLTLVPTAPTCGNNNGEIDLTITGGTLPYATPIWNGGLYVQEDLTVLAPGNYFVTVTDGNGCISTNNISISNISGPTLNAIPHTSTCGNANGDIDLQISAGVSPFTYTWSNGATTQDINLLIAGIYNVTVIDANGCIAVTNATVPDIAGPTFIYSTSSSTCTSANGGIDITVSGGTIPYLIDWNSGAYNTYDLTNVPAGTYNLIITDANSCTAGGTINLTDLPAATMIVSGVNPTCGFDNGSIDLSVVTGYGPFTFNWNSSSYFTEDISGLPAGTFTAIVSDANGCTSSINYTLNDVAGATLSTSAIDATCGVNNGSIDLTVSGGFSPYVYTWSNLDSVQDIDSLGIGLYTVTVTDANGCSSAISQYVSNIVGPFISLNSSPSTCGNSNGSAIVSGLAGTPPYTFIWSTASTSTSITSISSGVYYATLTDANSCQVADSVIVLNIDGPSLLIDSSNSNCSQPNGSAMLTVIGGTAPYSYNWNSGAYATEDLGAISAGNYSVIVTDGNGCTAIDSTTVNDNPGPTVLALTQTSATCSNNDGTASVVVTGGTAPYTYYWNSVPSQSTATATNLLGNTSYIVTVTDANGCSLSGSILVLDIAGPTIVQVITPTSCASDNGAIDISISNGTSPFNYLWSNGATTQDINSLSPGTYTLTVSDIYSCSVVENIFVDSIYGPYIDYVAVNTTCGLSNGSINVTVLGGTAPFAYDWNNGSFASQDLTGIDTGNYIMTLSDANGCLDSLAVVIIDNPSPTITASVLPASCGFMNGFASVQATGGAAPYTYLWNDFYASMDSFAMSLFGNQTYAVIVTDTNGCTVIDSVFVPNIAGPVVTSSSSIYSCGNNSGTIDLFVSGGTQPYTFDWNSGAYNTEDISGLSAGTYIGIITDSIGCQDFVIENLTAVPAPIVTSSINDATCGNNNGSINLTVSAGNPPFVYNWSNGSTSEDLSAVGGGIYYVTITDSYFCTHIDSFNILNGNAPILLASTTPSTCGNNNGAIDINVSSGIAPLTFLWDNGATTQDISNIYSGTYNLSVTDSIGCVTSLSVIVNDLLGPELSLLTTDATCGQTNGNIYMDISGFYPPYSVIWSNGSTDEDLFNISIGNYTVTVTDSIGCQAAGVADIFGTTSPLTTAILTNASCGILNGAIDLSVAGGFAPYSISWSNGATTEDISGLDSGNYIVTITDAFACVHLDTFNIINTTSPSVVSIITPETCTNVNAAINITVNGGTLPYTYLWSNGATTEDLISVSANTYSVTILDSIGCNATMVYTIPGFVNPVININGVNASCSNANGAATVLISSGSAPFTYVWNNGALTQSINNILDGTYIVTVTDSVGCIDIDSVIITTTIAPTFTSTQIQPTCATNNGSIDITTSNGIAPYLYLWSNGETTEDISNVGQGIYSLILSDAQGCIDTASIILNSSNGPVVSVTAMPDTICANITTSLIANGALTYSWAPAIFLNNSSNDTVIATLNSSVTFIVTGYDSIGCASSASVQVYVNPLPIIPITVPAAICIGSSVALNITGNDSYTWNADSSLNTTSGNTVIVNPTVNTTYYITATDSNGCINTDSTFVSVIPSPLINLVADNPGICIGETTNIFATGATNYSWSPNTFLIQLTDSTAIAAPTSTITYTVTATNGPGCTDTATVEIIVYAPPILNVTPPNPTICIGSTTVMLASGADQYFWSPATGLNMTIGSMVNASPTVQTTYTVTGVNADGCTSNISTVVSIGSNLTLTFLPNAPSICLGDSVNLNVAGADTFAWSPSVISSNSNGSVVNVSPTITTTYTVTGIEAGGCSGMDSIVVVVNPIPVVTSNNATICSGSSSVLGAQGAFFYQWTPASTLNTNFADTVIATPLVTTTYIVTGTTSAGCVDTSMSIVTVYPAPTASFTGLSADYCQIPEMDTLIGLPSGGLFSGNGITDSIFNPYLAGAGTHAITYTYIDSLGCSDIDTQLVNVLIAPVLTIDTVSICEGNSVVVNAYGATTYFWNFNPAIQSTINNQVTVLSNVSTTLTVIGINAAGCTDTTSTSVTVNPLPIVDFTGLDSVYCISATADTLIGIPAGGEFTGNGVQNNTFYPSLAGAGTHSITYSYTDSLGCTSTIVKACVVHSPAITVNASDPTICAGVQTILTASGAASYTWSPNYQISSTTGSSVIATPDTTINYVVTGTDSFSCSVSASVSITIGFGLYLTLSTNSPEVCKGAIAALTVSGADNYTWSPSNTLSSTTGAIVFALPNDTTTYTVIGTDVAGCSGIDSITVIVNPIPLVSTIPDSTICNGSSLVITAQGASDYSWLPLGSVNILTDSTASVAPSQNTTYTVIGTDINGCSASDVVSISVANNPNVSAINASICEGNSTTLNASGANTYAWSPSTGLNTTNGNSVIVNPSASTTYTIIGTSAQGCTAIAYSVVNVSNAPIVSFTGLDIDYCNNNAPVQLIGSPSGGTFSGAGMTGNIFNPQSSGTGIFNITYSFTNTNGCSGIDTQTVTVHAAPNVVVSDDEICLGEVATLNATGADTYSWLPATGLNTTTGSTVISNTTTPQQYTIVGTNGNGCTSAVIANVIVNPLPNLVINNGAPQICQGDDIEIVVGGATSYAWTPNIYLTSSTSGNVIISPSLNVTYTIIGTNSTGCADTIILPVIVLEVPIAVAGPDAAICAGGSVVISAAGNGTYQWLPSNYLSAIDTLNPLASPPQTTTFTFVTTAANGCTASDQVIVNVVNYPNINIIGGGVVCAGSSTVLAASGGVNYYWSPSTYLNTTIGSTVTSTPIDAITYTVTATNSIGCASTDSVVVKVKAPIQVQADPGTIICFGEEYQLNAYGDGVTYEWSPKPSLDNPYIPSPVASPTVTTTYTVTSSDLICSSDTATAVVVVHPLPVLTTQASVLVLPGSSTQLFANSNVSDVSYLWTPATGLSCSDCANPFANPTEPTNYVVTIIDSNGCKRSSEVELNFLCTEDGIYVPNAFTPNSDDKNDIFKIRGYGVREISVFRVFNRWGELVFETNDINQGWDGTFNGEPMFPAVFVYYVEGICTNNQVIVKQGNVTLIR